MQDATCFCSDTQSILLHFCSQLKGTKEETWSSFYRIISQIAVQLWQSPQPHYSSSAKEEAGVIISARKQPTLENGNSKQGGVNSWEPHNICLDFLLLLWVSWFQEFQPPSFSGNCVLINPSGDSEAHGLRVTAAMEQDFGELSRGLSKIPLCKVKQAKKISFKAIAITERGQHSDLTQLPWIRGQKDFIFLFLFHFKFLFGCSRS